jgi:hypothetical protein
MEVEVSTELKQITRKEWVEALHSGKYKQGRGQLEDEHGGLCCLGLACKLAGVDVGPSSRFHRIFVPSIGLNNTIGDLCDYVELKPVADMLNLNSDQCNDLAERNDEGWSFSAIAEYIEKMGGDQ